MKTKTEIFNEYLEEYLKASKEQKTLLLDHVCFVTKMHRKATIRKFRVLQLRDPCKTEKRGRSEYYGPDVTVALKEVWDLGYLPVRRMIGKEKDNSKYKRIYEKIPKTPYQRILEHTAITEDVKEKLRQEHAKLNPLILKKEMEKRLKKVYDIQRRFGNKRD